MQFLTKTITKKVTYATQRIECATIQTPFNSKANSNGSSPDRQDKISRLSFFFIFFILDLEKYILEEYKLVIVIKKK